jgi:hypothetical protein
MMDTFTLTIKLGNDAMQTGDDIADALMAVASKVRSGHEQGRIQDENGNTVGEFGVTDGRLAFIDGLIDSDPPEHR